MNVDVRKVPIARTSLTESEIESVSASLRTGWLVQGPRVNEFEDKWSKFSKVEFSTAVTSCTSALHLALVALGIKPGDEIILPAFTWVSTANIVEQAGAKPVFCDIDIVTFNIDTQQIAERITSRTRAIIPVHLFGLSANMEPILEICNLHGLKLVEDAACGFGSLYKGQHVGGFGDFGCFSFHPRKSITTGEGGMITTNDADLHEKVRCLRDNGAVVSDLQRQHGPQPYLLADHVIAGYNQRMTDFQAALGSAQMDRAHEIVAERQRLAANYDAEFAELEFLRTPHADDGFEHSYQSYACMFKPTEVSKGKVEIVCKARNEWMERLQNAGISTRPATHAVHMLSYYKEKYGLKPWDFPNSWAANDCSISLPLFHGMTEGEQSYVIDFVKNGWSH